MSTLFTKIIQREIPGVIVYEDEHCVAFEDIVKVAPTHILIVPREEVAGVSHLPETGDHTHLLNAAKKVGDMLGIQDYRLVINNGEAVGQTVPHLHIHFLAGREFGWPPG